MSSSMIGRYVILAELGRGGMATVYRARDPEFDRQVAIKVLPREFLHDPGFRARFQREAQTVAALEHSAIVPVYDSGEEQGQPYIVMRFMPGGSLADRLERGLPSLDEIVPLLYRIASALDSAHAEGIVHRDVKPANILFDRHSESYLSDFGIVKLTETTASLTGSGMVGTPAYMAPEMANPGGVSRLVDIYALGIVLYQMLTGQPPFQADTPIGILMAHVSKPVPNIREFRPDLPVGVQQTIAHALAKNPRERTQRASDMAEEFANALSGSYVSISESTEPMTRPAYNTDTYSRVPPPSQPRMQPRQNQQRSNPWLVRGIAVLAALCVLGIGVVGLLALVPGLAPGRLSSASPTSLAGLAGVSQTVTSGFSPTSSEQIAATITEAESTAPVIEVPTNTPTPTSNPTNTPTATFIPTAIPTLVPTLIPTAVPTVPTIPTIPTIVTLPPVVQITGQLAIVSNRDGNFNIYVINADGSYSYPLTNNPEDDSTPAWSPNGTQIAFRSKRDGNYEIYVMFADGSNQTRLTVNSVYDASPMWSPDGQRIVFESERDGNSEIYTMNANGSNVTRLTNNPADDLGPAFSPDGTRILFSSNRDGNYELYTMDTNGSNITRLTNNAATDRGRAWSPDGGRIAFRSNRDGNYEIYVMNANGSNPVRLTSNSAEDIAPAWSFDGKWIAFRSNRDGNYEIYAVSPDGKNLVRVTNNPADDYDPVWRP